MPRFIPTMQPSLVDAPPAGDEWLWEIKRDGWRLQAHTGPEFRLYSREGKSYGHQLVELREALSGAPDGVYDGELCWVADDGSCDFPGLQRAMLRGRGDGFVFYAFDVLKLDGRDLRGLPLIERKAALREALEPLCDTGLIQVADHHQGDGPVVFDALNRMPQMVEGLVGKRVSSTYRSGKVAGARPQWVKVKTARWLAANAERGDAWRKPKAA